MGYADNFKYEYKNNKYYKRYEIQRDKIRNKHDILVGNDIKDARKEVVYTKEDKEKFRAYLKDIADLLLKPNGWFQKFVWDDLSQEQQKIMERRSRSRLNGSKYL